MKRSEALAKIKRVWADSTSWPTDKYVADAILKEVEKFMEPPSRWVWFEGYPKQSHEHHHGVNGEYVSGWEEE